MNDGFHVPVLLQEVLQYLRVRPEGGVYVDATLGGGGYAERLLAELREDGLLIGIDQDEDAIRHSTQRLERFTNFKAVRGNFSDLGNILDELGIKGLDGIVFDLGLSSHLVDSAERGFSFRKDAALDMRMDRRFETTAHHLVMSLLESELESLLRTLGEEPFARRIARRIVEHRKKNPLETTKQLADLVWHTYPARMRHGRTHPATRTFQAFRMAVNEELDVLQRALDSAVERLSIDGRVVCVSYHSLEDRMVKQTFKKASTSSQYSDGIFIENTPRLRILTPKPVVPTPEEVDVNPRARSAKLRAAVKI